MRSVLVVSVFVSVASALISSQASVASQPQTPSESITGAARALDGDTLDLATASGAVRVRLQGIDAAEGGQRCNLRWIGTWDCGRTATIGLAQLVDGQTVTCTIDGRDKYDRALGVCFAADRNINAALVREGLAWAYVQYSTLFVAEETEARKARRGIWQAATQPPWEWRAQQRARHVASAGAAPLPPHQLFAPQQRQPSLERYAATPQAPSGCDIKGNVSKSGDRIYHTVESPWYKRIRMDIGAGRRWFCSEGEAREAGWRPVGAAISAQ